MFAIEDKSGTGLVEVDPSVETGTLSAISRPWKFHCRVRAFKSNRVGPHKEELYCCPVRLTHWRLFVAPVLFG